MNKPWYSYVDDKITKLWLLEYGDEKKVKTPSQNSREGVKSVAEDVKCTISVQLSQEEISNTTATDQLTFCLGYLPNCFGFATKTLALVIENNRELDTTSLCGRVYVKLAIRWLLCYNNSYLLSGSELTGQ